MPKFRPGQPITASILNGIKQAMRSMITSGPGVTINSSGDKIVIGVDGRGILRRDPSGRLKIASTQDNLGTPLRARIGVVTAYVTGGASVTKDVFMAWDLEAAGKEIQDTDDWRVISILTATSVANLGVPTNPPAFGIVDTGTENRALWIPADGTTNGDWRDFNRYGAAAS